MALARRADVTFEIVDDRAVLVDPEGVEVVVLNPVGTIVWEALDGTRDAEAIAGHVVDRVPDAPGEQIVRDVALFLDELRAAGLVSDTP